VSYFIKTEDGWIKTRASTLESAIKIADNANLHQIAEGKFVDAIRIIAVKASIKGLFVERDFWIRIPSDCQISAIVYEGIITK